MMPERTDLQDEVVARLLQLHSLEGELDAVCAQIAVILLERKTDGRPGADLPACGQVPAHSQPLLLEELVFHRQAQLARHARLDEGFALVIEQGVEKDEVVANAEGLARELLNEAAFHKSIDPPGMVT